MRGDNKNMLKILFPLILFMIMLLPSTSTQGADNMQNYCLIPPFLAQSISPNVLIVLDNSLSMCGQAYAGSYDPTQFKNGLYYGYFDGEKNYKYTGNNRWEVTTDAMATGTVANPIATGSFLNWATMRRVEVSKKLLIGGKANPRSPQGAVTVKLDGETACGGGWDFNKDFNTGTFVGDTIFPFVGDYNFARSGGVLDITPNVGGVSTFLTRPNADISVPAGWSEFPAAAPVTAWDKVDEAAPNPTDDTDYIQNNNTTSPVILDYDYTQAKPAGVITVRVYVRARYVPSGNNQTRRIQGVLRIGGVNYASNYSNISTSYSNYSFTWATNPATGLAWDWNDIKSAGIGSLQGFGVQAYQNYTSRYPRVTRVYFEVSVATPTGGPFNTIVDQGFIKAEGIIDNITEDVRFGLAYYANGNEGGRVENYVGFGMATNMITSIHNMSPSTYTPLGETLYEMVRYYRQDAPYYNNNPADYSVAGNAASMVRDPYWYKLSDLDSNYTDRYVPCAKSFILFLTDGESTQDQSIPGASTSSPYAACSLTNIKACSGFGGAPNNPNPRFAGTSIGTTYSIQGTDYMPDVAYWARTNDMRPGTETDVPTSFRQSLPGTQNVTLYPVFMFGVGSTLLKDAAIYGGFDDIKINNKPDCTTVPDECYRDTNGDGKVASPHSANSGVCSGAIPTVCTEDTNCTSPATCEYDFPLTYYEGNDGYALEQSITNAIAAILRKASSGTAASVLASGEESGANILQAVFYPKRSFDNGTVDWTGTLQNLWFYIDPLFNASSIREDTDQNSILHLQNDYVARFRFDVPSQTTLVDLFRDVNGDYSSLTSQGSIETDDLKNLWEAGKLLWQRNISTSPRTIKTYIGDKSGGKPVLQDFSTALTNEAVLRPYLQAANNAESEAIIRYIHGEDTPFTPIIDTNGDGVSDFSVSYRGRTVEIDLSSPPDGDTLDPGEGPKVWKLGDIISSTPKVSSWVPQNTYDVVYEDDSYAKFICKDKTLLCASEYDKRGRVFTGANDGMLHAFKLGTLQLRSAWPAANFEQARILNPDTGLPCSAADAERCGAEVWSFIPKHVLPYLKYNADIGYCHLFNVDGIPYLFDASIGEAAALQRKSDGTSWRSILIGSMKHGGACRGSGFGCDTLADAECVEAPGVDLNGDGDKTDIVNGNDESKLGLSSYFAIDITDIDPANWTLLWEFSDENIPALELSDGGLGFSTTGPAVVRINPATCQDAAGNPISDKEACNGEWFVAIPSGPTGPIDTATRQFMGRSDQKLKVFVIDARTGEYKAAIKTFNGAAIDYAFGGSAMDSVLDPDLDYQDDGFYLGYTNKVTIGGVDTWTNGGVIRIMTTEDPDPTKWVGSKLIENIGPVTAAVSRMEDTNTNPKKLWTYFGTGRYFFKQFGVIDDAVTQRRIYGVKDPCYIYTASGVADPADTFTTACATTVSAVALDDATTVPLPDDPEDPEGWFIDLDASGATYDAERVTTDPVASTIGATFFTTFKPTADICGYGGRSHLWAVKYNTGGTATDLLRGKALIQVSTGSIEEIDLKTAFDETGPGGSNPDSKDDRRSGEMIGKSPEGPGLILLTAPPPTEKVIHMREK